LQRQIHGGCASWNFTANVFVLVVFFLPLLHLLSVITTGV
jgi:hypothetical protein